jgi:predicted O-linked N-acetylglucosamine transferase (SPINDLY family)
MPLNIVNKEDIFGKGIAAHTSGRFPEAEKFYRQVLQLDPNHAGAYQNLGVLAFQVGRNDAAIPLLKKALEFSPNNASMYCNLGDAYTALRQGDEALASYKKAVELDPNMPTTYNNLGIVYSRLGKVEEAITSWKKAIELSNRPLGSSRVLIGHGGGSKTPAEESKSLAAAAYNNLGNAYLQKIELDKALECHMKACEMSPEYSNARSNMLRDYTHIPNIPHATLLAEHKKWWTIHAAGIKKMSHSNSRDPNRKIRVGWISPDFREHSVTHFLLPLFQNYDKSQFDYICYAGVSRPDDFTRMLAQCAPTWRNTLGVQDIDVAKQIQADQIDILVDLSGHTSDHRLLVFAHKPAPIQIAYLGYPMTSGATPDIIEWHLTDALVDPPGESDKHYSEKLYRLPTTNWCYRPPVNIPCQESPAFVRNPQAPFTYGSFNNCSKMSEITFRVWAKVLHATPGSRLMLKASAMADDNTRGIIHERFAKEGIPAERIVLVPQQVDLAQHFAYYGNIDLGLDTYSYNGTTTTCEALWMNVPVLTLAGDNHISRVGLSLLTNVGLPQLIAHNEDEFVKIAASYFENRDSLVELRKGLRAKLQSSNLMNGKKFADEFGDSLRDMWKQWSARGD